MLASTCTENAGFNHMRYNMYSNTGLPDMSTRAVKAFFNVLHPYERVLS